MLCKFYFHILKSEGKKVTETKQELEVWLRWSNTCPACKCEVLSSNSSTIKKINK
jgi:hypothetical protein